MRTRVAEALERLNPTPPRQRPYVASHPLGLLFAIGVAVQGALYLLAPAIFHQSAATEALSQVILYAFNATWLVGGTMSAIGILFGLRKAEGFGMALLGGGFAAYYLIVAQAIPFGWLTGIFIGFLAVACFLRSRHVAKTGYVTVETQRPGRP